MAQADIQALLDTQPVMLPASVARVTADGKPTTHLLDWELFQTNWFKSNIIKTDQRIDTVQATADDASAAVTVETNARVSADEALATQITTVDAKANSATANGQIYFAAGAGPSGSAAAYGLYLTAGNAFTGFEAIAMSDGTSVIGFSANQFVFTDSGAAKQVFTYSGGKFVFTGDVAVDGSLMVNGTVIADKIADNAVSNSGAGSTSNDTTTLTFTVPARRNDRVTLFVTVLPTSTYTTGTGGGTFTASFDGSTQSDVAYAGMVGLDTGGSPIMRVNPCTYQFTWTATSGSTSNPSSRTITVTNIPFAKLKGVAFAFSK